MIPIRLHPEAEAEVQDAAEWYERQQPGLGADFLSEVDRALATIAESPHTWPLWPGVKSALPIRRFLLARFPCGIAYEETRHEIVVHAVAHASRRPGYWMDRLSSPE